MKLSRRWVRLAALVLLVLLPLIGHFIYSRLTDLPTSITLATGPRTGQYQVVIDSLADRIKTDLGITVNKTSSAGSLENLLLVESGAVDFALYQPATLDLLKKYAGEFVEEAAAGHSLSVAKIGDQTRFVANVYQQPTHLIVRRGAGIERAEHLQGKRISLGTMYSGDHAVGLLVLDHLGFGSELVQIEHLDYPTATARLKEGSLDAVFTTMGLSAPAFGELFASGHCDLLSLPHAEALVLKYPAFSRFTIPEGFHAVLPVLEPPGDVNTVALPAQLLAHASVSEELAYAITRIVMDEQFQRANGLRELFARGREFALDKPEFPVHRGTRTAFGEDAFHISEFESWEALYSLIASAGIGVYLAFRFVQRQRERRNEHRLDRYIRRLLAIERRQIALDSNSRGEDIETLQRLLDEVTILRQDALSEFTAHELNEDRAADCFIEMCHALCDKLNAKISRQRLDRAMTNLSRLFEQSRTVGHS